MEKTKKSQIAKYLLATLIIIFSFFLWRSVSRAVFIPGASDWGAPILFASLLLVTLFLGIYIIKEKTTLRVAVLIGLATALFFSANVLFGLVLILAALMAWLGERSMTADLQDRIRLGLIHNMRFHSKMIVWALCLVIAGQYYFLTKDLATVKYIPRFEVSKEVSGAVFRSVAGIFPALQKTDLENLTVDRFIWETYVSQRAGSPGASLLEEQPLLKAVSQGIDPGQKAILEESLQQAERNEVLAQGRKQLSELVGRTVSGEEKIAEIFPEIVNRRINNFFLPSIGKSEKSSLFSGIIALIILLTAVSVSPFLMILWALGVSALFFLVRKLGVVEVEKVPVEKETIV